MGIAKGAACLLYELKRDHPIGGTILQLGKQSLYVEADQLPGIAQRFGFTADISNVSFDETGEYVESTYNDIVFFQKLGFQQVLSLDVNDYEGASIVHDMNEPISASLSNKFNFVYDGGTLEHIFDLPQCLRNIHALLKVDGLVAHAQVSHNHLDHGFYMFSPTLFWDYYHANGYRILKSYLFEYETEHTAYTANDWLIYDYKPTDILHIGDGGWGRKPVGIWFVAQKLEHSTCDVIPQQGAYMNTWGGTSSYNPYHTAQQRTFSSAVKSKLKSLPLVGFLLTRISQHARRFHNHHMAQQRPPIIARY